MIHAKYNTIVLGLGAMGSAALYHLAKRGNKVLGIDQFSPPHSFGSSHGETRITRQAIGEGAEYVPLVLRSYELFREIQKETGKQLLIESGGLIISSKNASDNSHGGTFFQNTVDAANRYNIKYEILAAEQIRQRFPLFNVTDNEQGYYEPGAGILLPEECVSAQLDLAKKHGAEIHTEEKVTKYEATADQVTVFTNKGEYSAEKLIVAAGTWLPDLIPEKFKTNFRVTRQVVHWFDAKESIEPLLVTNLPIFIWKIKNGSQAICGIPALHEKGGLKIYTEQNEVTTHPDSVDRTVGSQETQEFYEKLVEPNLVGVSDRCLKSIVCLYNYTPDFNFIIDKHPDHSNVIIASPCSGHGFKHSAAVGETLAELVIDGKTKIDISKFSINRFATVQK